MAEKVFKFDLELDRELIEIYDKTLEMHSALHDIVNYLRDKVKYSELSTEERKIYEQVKTDIHELLIANEINI